jgi:aminoglycoside phosphotransferase (APT) family kinase protein
VKLDIENAGALIDYLRERRQIGAEEKPIVSVLAGGVSNRTVLVQRATGEAWVIKQALAKLRVAVDWFSSPERNHCEALGLRYLSAMLPSGTVPGLIFEDTENHVLAMQAVPAPHTNWKQMLLAGQVEPDHIRQFAQMLGDIHRQSSQRRAELMPVFEDRTFFESTRVEPYYSYSGQQVPESGAFYADLMAETRATQVAIVHGDYSPKNVLVHQGRLVLLDFEVIHFGDPAFDVGFSLTHLLSKAHHLPSHRQRLSVAANHYWRVYEEAVSGLDWATPNHEYEARAARHTLACLLARVAGRSPLEYLSREEKDRQRAVVVVLMNAPPVRIPDLIDRFIAEISQEGN